MLACTSCSSKPSGDGQAVSEMTETPRGATEVETYQTTATVTAIDPATRRITLTAPDGKQTTFVAGPEVRNFDQIQVGDQVKTTTTESVAVSLRPAGTPPSAGESSTVEVAPKGAKPGALMTDTTEVTAKIMAIDPKHRTVTLQFADGTTRSESQAGCRSHPRESGRECDHAGHRVTAIQVEKP